MKFISFVDFEHEKMPIDILYGSDALRRAVADGSVRSLIDGWKADEDQFRRLREPFLLY